MEHNRVIYERPYDAEVEYLESTGTQWIDTGIMPDNTYTFDCKVAKTLNKYNCVFWGTRNSGNSRSENNQCYLNSNDISGGSDRIRLINLYSTSQDASSNWSSNIIPSINTMYELTDMTVVPTMNSMIYPITLFAFNIIGDINTGLGKCRIGYWKCYSNGQIVCDFIPVRKGNIGYMYDKVSKKLFANKGTGNFILGQDVANPVPNIRRVFRFGNKRFVMPMPYDSKIEYLESTGTQWIDTGIYGSNNSKVEVDLQLLELGASKAVFGCYSATDIGLYLYQAGGNDIGKWQFGFGWNANAGTTDTNRHFFVFDNFKIKIDGTIIISATPRNFTTTHTLLMFNMHNKSGGIYSATSMRIFSCKLYNNSTLVRDFIPVRKGNVGYMYDKVSGKLFGNSGTGQFILGNDIND